MSRRNRTTEHVKAITCPRCNGSEFSKAGIVKEKQRYRCKCGYNFRLEIPKSSDEIKINKAYHKYMKTNWSIQRIADDADLEYSTLYKWMREPYCKNPRNQWNPFAKSGQTKTYFNEIEKGIAKYETLNLLVRYFKNQASVYVIGEGESKFRAKIFTLCNPRHNGAGGTEFKLLLHLANNEIAEDYVGESAFGNRVATLDKNIVCIHKVTIEEFFEVVMGQDEFSEYGIESLLQQYYKGVEIVKNKKRILRLSKVYNKKKLKTQ